MDEEVRRALARWPDVPACHGWLALDRRGRWRLRDEYAQRHGLLGDIVRHPTLKAYIDRNYERTLQGAWYFQNGPQRVYVDLESTPFVLFLEPDPAAGTPRCLTHTGAPVHEARTAYVDHDGNFYLAFDAGQGEQVGLVCDRDLGLLLDTLRDADGQLPGPQQTLDLLAAAPYTLRLDLACAAAPLRLHSVAAADLPGRFDFVPRPRPSEPG